MDTDSPYFFCGIGGSGMLPLALIVQARGAVVGGSDRSLDQGRTAAKFEFLKARGIALFPQDGSGVTSPDQIVVASAAVEDAVPDIKAALAVGARRLGRAELLSQLFNASPRAVGVAGTSGKSTTTGMIGWMLHALGLGPTVMNGAVMRNFATPDTPFASALVGNGDLFVAEVDESDGSIARYTPHVAVLNNVAHDHKSMEELRRLFRDFLAKAAVAVVNRDNAEAAALADALPPGRRLDYSLSDTTAGLWASDITPARDGVGFVVHEGPRAVPVRLKVPGRHNAANALAALGTARALGIGPAEAVAALEGFTGIKRRLETVGTRNGVTIIDDFAHNPDKITASLETLKTFPGRLLILFQPHGYGPLKLMRDGFVQSFAAGMGPDDLLVMPDPAYFGGTVKREVGSTDIARGIRSLGRDARAIVARPDCAALLLNQARPGDRIVIMGARDDTLSQLAEEMLGKL